MDVGNLLEFGENITLYWSQPSRVEKITLW